MVLFIFKNKVIRICFILYFSFLINEAYTQSSDEKFVNQNCEYLYFVNDSLIDFMLIGDFQGSIATIYHGLGIYIVENNHLIIIIEDYEIDSLNKMKDNDTNCSNFEERIRGTYKYKIETLSHNTIKLIGPIRNNYKKQNRQRFLKSFINWPWKWSFKKQHWYDPRVRELYKLYQ